MTRGPACIATVALLAALATPARAMQGRRPCVRGIRVVQIEVARPGHEGCARYAELFAKHLRRRAPHLAVRVVPGANAMSRRSADALLVRAGTCAQDPVLRAWFAPRPKGCPRPQDPGPEGFELDVRQAQGQAGPCAVIAGVDARGVLYGLGQLLRLMRLTDTAADLPVVSLRTAPRVPVRSANGSFKVCMDPRTQQRTGARKWTRGEAVDYFEEQLLLGANTLTHGWGRSAPVSLARYDEKTVKGVTTWYGELAQNYGVHYFISNAINGIGSGNMQPEWRAKLAGRRDPMLACPSIPAARQAILRCREIAFKHAPAIHSVKVSPADIAGCECEKCRPWVETYYALARDIADMLHKYHPRAKLLVSNQGFSHEDNEWMFGRIRDERPAWLGGYCYAPGGSEASTYGGLAVNGRWSRLPDPELAFLESRQAYLQPQHAFAALVDVSHWKRAQHGLRWLDPAFAEVYHRRTFNARPQAYKRIIGRTLACASDLHAYSEGIFDDFNKFVLLRLAWDPSLSAQDIAREYYTYYCGEAAGAMLAKAVFIGERNYERPVLTNAKGIEQFHAMVRRAGEAMPTVYRRGNWRYLMLLERATIDLYLLRKTQAAQGAYDRAGRRLRVAQTDAELDEGLALAEAQLKWPIETDEMKSLADETGEIENELNRIAGLRFWARLTMTKVDSVGVRWLAAQVRRARSAASVAEARMIVEATLKYDVAGEGEFYDNCGTLDAQPHFDFSTGQLSYGVSGLPGDSRPSQRTYNYSNESQDGLRFRYSGLDTEAEYEITLARSNPKISFMLNSPNEFDVLANGRNIGRGRPSGKGLDVFTFRVPKDLTAGGKLTVELRKVPGRARCTCTSEIWLRKVRADRRSGK